MNVRELIERAYAMSQRLSRYDYSIGDYWNLAEDAADALEATLARLEKAEAVCDAAHLVNCLDELPVKEFSLDQFHRAKDDLDAKLEAWKGAAK